ncbi:unnamed protein product, partial [Ceratitis capitata]
RASTCVSTSVVESRSACRTANEPKCSQPLDGEKSVVSAEVVVCLFDTPVATL